MNENAFLNKVKNTLGYSESEHKSDLLAGACIAHRIIMNSFVHPITGKCPYCNAIEVDPCGRGGKRCTKCNKTFGAD